MMASSDDLTAKLVQVQDQLACTGLRVTSADQVLAAVDRWVNQSRALIEATKAMWVSENWPSLMRGRE
jgi:hypothetical protein